MKRKTTYSLALISSLMALPACTLLSGYPRHYSTEAIEAKVIDTETKQPLEGVIVVANWELRGPATAGGSAPIGQLMVLETVTDKDGRFSFPAWGPKPARGALLNRDPQLLLFKPGYRYRGLENEFRDGMELEPVRRSDWSGKTIEMKRFKGSLEEYEKHLAFLKTSLGFAYNGENCEWKLAPRMLVSQHREKLRLDKAGIFNTLRSVESVAGQKRCGSAEEFFRDYLP